MKLVIDVPEEIIITCMQHNMPVDCEMFARKMVLDIANGTPIPKGHGRLIDADALARFIDYGHLNSPDAKMYSENDIRDLIDNAPTIIEAEKEDDT